MGDSGTDEAPVAGLYPHSFRSERQERLEHVADCYFNAEICKQRNCLQPLLSFIVGL